MQALVEITPWHWGGFIVCIIIFLALDLGLLHRDAHEVKYKEALAWTLFWFSLSLLFAGVLTFVRSQQEAVGVLYRLFHRSLPVHGQRLRDCADIYVFPRPDYIPTSRAFWGILGALVMRGTHDLGGCAAHRTL